MKFFRINAKLLATLFVQENRQSNAPRGLSYLPGATLRGAVAAKFLRCGGSPDDPTFREIFLEDPVHFPDLLPSNSPDGLSSPLPLSAYSCKRTPGFTREAGHGVEDSLAGFAGLAASEIEQRPGFAPAICRECGQDMAPFQGFWNGNTELPEKADPVFVYHRHTGIDRHTGTVASSMFYITQGIAERRKGENSEDYPQFLSGGLFLKENQFRILSQWLDEPVFAGADRSRGMGEIEIRMEEQDAPDFDLDNWDREFRDKVANLGAPHLPSGLYFSIGLSGHLIMVDRFLRPVPECELLFPGIRPVTRVIRGQVVRGWQSSWGLPKPEDTAVSMGGVYLFRYEGDEKAGLRKFLRNLQIKGLGLRCAEGFGSMTVCDSIHIQEVM